MIGPITDGEGNLLPVSYDRITEFGAKAYDASPFRQLVPRVYGRRSGLPPGGRPATDAIGLGGSEPAGAGDGDPVGGAETSPTYAFTTTIADVADLGSPVLEKIQAQVTELMAARIKAWERATLEAAFDCGVDLRQPWGIEVAVFAEMSWNHTFGPRRLPIAWNVCDPSRASYYLNSGL